MAREYKKRLDVLNNKTKIFNSHIKDARNKIIAHYDKTSFLKEEVLGEISTSELECFIKDLEEICNIIHTTCFGSFLGQIVVSGSGDVQEFKKSLKKALAFDKVLSNGNFEEKIKMMNYFTCSLL